MASTLAERFSTLVHMFIVSPDGAYLRDLRMNEDILDLSPGAGDSPAEVEAFLSFLRGSSAPKKPE